MLDSTATLDKTDEATLVTTDTNFLNATHRCDGPACSAAAFVKVVLNFSEKLPEGGELLFCSHHYNKVEEKIKPFALEVFDERHKLQQNKLVGTENN